MSVTDDGQVAVLFGQWFAAEGLGVGVTVESCRLLARAFIAGYVAREAELGPECQRSKAAAKEGQEVGGS